MFLILIPRKAAVRPADRRFLEKVTAMPPEFIIRRLPDGLATQRVADQR